MKIVRGAVSMQPDSDSETSTGILDDVTRAIEGHEASPEREPCPLSVEGRIQKSVSLVAYGYNEELSVGRFFEKAIALLDATVEEYEIIFVDDGSTDRTNEIVSKLAGANPSIVLLTNEINRNIGYSWKRGVAAASKEYLFWQTVDWSYDLTHLRIFLELLERYDVVVGLRPTPERLLSHIPVIRSIYRVNSRSDDFLRAFVSLSNYYILKILFGLNFYDFQNIQFHRRETIQGLKLKGESSFLSTEILSQLNQRGARFIEVPIKFLPRQQGNPKGIRPSAIWISMCDIAVNWLDWGWRMRLAGREGPRSRQIYRASEPQFLKEDEIVIMAPLFKYFR